MSTSVSEKATPRVSFQAQLRFLASAEGGRATPVRTGYRPLCDFHPESDDLSKGYNDCLVEFEGRSEVAPGEECRARITPLSPERLPGALAVGQSFAITEGPRRVVARGTILAFTEA